MNKLPKSQIESHRTDRTGWLRAAVLGANDGILSTASLIVGVAAAHAARYNILLTGIAGVVSGALSMAAGEYVSVSSQSDTQKADLTRERIELATDVHAEQEELTHIYVNRGLDRTLAKQVALQLMAHDAIGAHARDELGISATVFAHPIQAALTSAVTFSMGGALPLFLIFILPTTVLIPAVFIACLLFLALLGAIAARMGGAEVLRGAIRVTFWGALAMGFTAGIGALFGGSK